MTLKPMIAAMTITTAPAIATFFQVFIDPRPRGLSNPSSGRSEPNGAPARCTYIRSETAESFIGKQLLPKFQRKRCCGWEGPTVPAFLARHARTASQLVCDCVFPSRDYTRGTIVA